MPSNHGTTSAAVPVLPETSAQALPATRTAAQRLPSIDRLRGLVIALMALDHVRDYFSVERISPTDLTQTTPLLFFTRWITHYCAPIFIFLAGTSARLLSQRTTRAQLQRFLLTRGLWLVALEFSVVSFVWAFNFRYPLGLVMQVIWATGVSMCALAGLVALPRAWIAGIAVLMIAGHNLLDGIQPAHFGAFAPLWIVLHVQASIPGGEVVYPLVPWIGVMAAGYVFGDVFELPIERRRRVIVRSGLALTGLFVVIRALNGYGDPQPWAAQSRALFTLLSFLNVSKYPPSLCYLLLTLGPGLLLLRALEHAGGPAGRAVQTLGRVPLFSYVVHLAILHLLAGVIALALGFGPGVLTDLFLFFPKDWGFGLAGVYAAWIAVLALLYPLCVWFARWKRRRSEWWVSYL